MIGKKIDFFKYIDNFERYKNVESKLIFGDINVESPLVSIVIPTYKRPDLLKEAIESALNQNNYYNYEVIVVDNEGLIDVETDTEKLIKSYNNKKLYYYKNEKNIGLFGNWNRCIELAKGNWITLLNDDDFLDNNFLNKIMNLINNKVGIKALYSGSRIIYDIKNVESSSIFKNLIKSIIYKIVKRKKIVKLDFSSFYTSYRAFGSLGIIFSKKDAINVGGFNEKFYPISDYIFFTNYTYKYGNTYKLKEKLCTMRYNNNISLSLDVINKTIKQNFIFRNYIQSKSKIPKMYHELYSKQRVALDIDKNVSKFNLNRCEFPKIRKRDIYKILVEIVIALDTLKYELYEDIK